MSIIQRKTKICLIPKIGHFLCGEGRQVTQSKGRSWHRMLQVTNTVSIIGMNEMRPLQRSRCLYLYFLL
jgi:hypothetical protein